MTDGNESGTGVEPREDVETSEADEPADVGPLPQRQSAMTESISESRWEEFYDSFEKAAELVVGFGPDPTLSGLITDFIGDGDDTDALLFGVADVLRSDDRPRARELAELLIPQAQLMIHTYDGDDAVELGAFVETLDRLKTVVTAQESGTAVPASFREELEAWWDALIAQGDLDTAVVQAKARLADATDLERHWIHEILIGWIYSDDQWRWQPALMLLQDERVHGAPEQMRFAAAFARLPEKRAFADTFNRIADELEQTIQDEGRGPN